MNADRIEVASWLALWFKERRLDLNLSPHDNYFELGAIDSFGVIELIEATETRFKIHFTETDFQDRRFTTLDGLAGMISEKTSNG